jgi:glycosyltransferase involved in cell wall biosynthesis
VMPSVSICIPAYRDPIALSRCLDSVARQQYPDFEVVIADDSRGDEVESVVRHHALADRILYRRNVTRLGSPANWNQVISLARGELIKILHHDDSLSDAGSLGKFVHLLQGTPDAWIGFSACYDYSPQGKRTLHDLEPPFMRRVQRDPHSLFPDNLIGSPSTSIHRRDPRIQYDTHVKWVVDMDYYMRYLSAHGGLVYTREPLVDIHHGVEQVTNECLRDSALLNFEWTYLYERIRRPFKPRRFWFMVRIYKNHGIPDRSRLPVLLPVGRSALSPPTRVAQAAGRAAKRVQLLLTLGRRRNAP